VTPGARLQAAIEVLDLIRDSRAPADGVLKSWGREHRFAGSGDRRAIAERVYSVLRARVRLSHRMDGDDGRALVVGALHHLDGLPPDEIGVLFSGGHHPAPLTDAERELLLRPQPPAPDWVEAGAPEFIVDAFKSQFGDSWADEARALVMPRAPVDLRVNALRGGVDGALRLLATEDYTAEPTPWSARGLRMPPAAAPDVQKLRAYTGGWIEVQDEASQIAGFLADARPGETVVDYCAGGGGKTLIFAQCMKAVRGHAGRLIACDVNQKRLDVIPERLDRAGAVAELRRTGSNGEGTEDLVAKADLVFVDAPCSGSGTWRRHPEGAWRLVPASVTRLAALQLEIVTRAARLVRPGGRLAYATCSVLDEENAAVADAFLAAHPDFAPLPIAQAARTPNLTDAARERLSQIADGHRLLLTPHRTHTDGFFLALFTRRPAAS
jgi:16S rRNA (cytosine967-C5)-methyltransferase